MPIAPPDGNALVTAVPALVAALAAWRVNRKVETNHGKTIGQHVEAQGEELRELRRGQTRMNNRLRRLEKYTHRRWHDDDQRYTAIALALGILFEVQGLELPASFLRDGPEEPPVPQ